MHVLLSCDDMLGVQLIDIKVVYEGGHRDLVENLELFN